jgi:iron complex outermembrane recepter protein
LNRFCLFLASLCFSVSFGQTDTALHQLKTVEVESSRNTYRNETAMNKSDLKVFEMRQQGAFNISDALSKIPGVSQMSTGVAITKPVIRGLYGNRIQTVLSGLRFDNQQWQDEHGLGITDIGIDRVEVIKGPASLLYGSEAIGGVINIIEEKAPAEGIVEGDLNTRYVSNTMGNATDIGFKGTIAQHSFRIRGGYESDADYTDGNNKRVLNSRFDGYYAKVSYGFTREKWICRNNYNFSKNDFGFIMANNQFAILNDDRNSRSFKGPHHTVYLNIVSSENIFMLKNSMLKINLGGQYNNRLEDEGGGEISLDMLLTSLVYNLQWIKMIGSNTELILSNQSILQRNMNYGKRKIVPDANIQETGLSLFVNQKVGALTIEGGIGGNYKRINALLTKNFNDDSTKETSPYERSLPALNGMLGLTYNPDKHWNFKICGSTGYRSGNLAELSSDGLHEGTYSYEIGNPDLNAEQNMNAEIALNYLSEHLDVYVNAFNNYFRNYIYLSPTDEFNTFVFPVFRYRQGKANLYGGEAGFVLKPVKQLKISCDYSAVTGALNDSSYLPFIPAPKLRPEARYTFRIGETSTLYVMAGCDYVFPQRTPAVDETSTIDYALLNAGIGTDLSLGKFRMTLSITGNNLLNKAYYDHLSRFKAYGIKNIGRNIVINLRIPLTLVNKNKKTETK